VGLRNARLTAIPAAVCLVVVMAGTTLPVGVTAADPAGATPTPLILTETPLPEDLSPAPPDSVIATWPDSILALRLRGEYEPALALARDLLAHRRGRDGTPAFERADAAWTVRTLETIGALAPAERRRVREADSLGTVGSGHFDAGAWAIADSLITAQLAILRLVFGPDHPEVAESLSFLGVIRLNANDPEGARPSLEESLALRRRSLGEEHPVVAGAIGDLAQVAQSLGENDRAESLSREAADLYRRIGAEDDPAYALLLNNLASIPLERGDYASAEPLFREALARLRPVFGAQSPEVAAVTANLASLQAKRGNDAEAEPLYREALAIQEQAASDHPNMALFLTNLAEAQRRLGELDAAEEACRRALGRQRRTLEAGNPDLAVTLITLGEIVLQESKAEDAVAAFREALTICRAIRGGESKETASALHGLGTAYFALGQLAAADSSLRTAEAIRVQLLGERHPYTVETRLRRGLVRRALGDLSGADSLLTLAAGAYEWARLRAGAGLERASFMASPYPFLAVVRLERGLTDQAWPQAERDLGRALADLLRAASDAALTPRAAAVRDSLKTALSDLEGRLGAFVEAARTDTTAQARARVEETRVALLGAESRWAALQQEQTATHPAIAAEPIPLERARLVLGKKAAILGWCEAEMRPGEIVAWAYVVRADGPVRWARVGGSAPSRFLSEAKDLRRDVTKPEAPNAVWQREARGVYGTWVAPLEPFLAGVEDLVVIPSGSLRRIPLEALVDTTGSLLGDRFAISYTPSTAVYAWLVDRTKDGRTGEDRPGEGSSAIDPARPVPKRPTRTDAGGGASIGPMLLVGDPPFSASRRADLRALPPLIGTRDEVMSLATLAPGSRVLLGRDASETEMQRLAATDSLASFVGLHFATHALVDDRRPENSALVLSQDDLPDPLEAALRGDPSVDGLVTAGEIVRGWRLHADLVTLSACETGLGRDLGGEGTIGFAHAFFQAGARGMLVSLWKVEDQATALLMQRFYQNLKSGSASPGSTAQALREAKRWLRDYTGAEGRTPYRHPYYWSAFVLIGARG
jgi:CHAT domain-containing protein/Tfp pilus assembly protein PilF